MADWSLASSARTSMIGENGLLEGQPDGGVGGSGHGGAAEENAGGIDETSEWAQVGMDSYQSFTTSLLISDLEPR